MKSTHHFYFILIICTFGSLHAVSQVKATLSPTARWASVVGEQYWIHPDITYGVANNYTLKLDVWQRNDAKTPVPTLIYSTEAAGCSATGLARHSF